MLNFLKGTFKILLKDEKILFVFSLLLILLATFFEFIGFGTLLPLVTLIIKQDSELYSNSLINFFFNTNDKNEILKYLILILGISFIMKNLILLILSYFQSYFAFRVQRRVSSSLYSHYLKNDYEFHVKSDSSLLVRNVLKEVDQFTSGMVSITILISELFLISSIGIILFIFNPLLTISSITIISIYAYTYQSLTKKFTQKLGIERQKLDGKRFKEVQESLNSIFDIKTYKSESFFIKRFDIYNYLLCNTSKFQTFIQSVPRITIEIMMVVVLTLLMIYFIKDNNIFDIFPTLTIFVAVAFRLMPSTTRILSSLQVVRFTLPSLKILVQEISTNNISSKNNSKIILKIGDIIAVNSLTFKYSNESKKLINNLNLSFKIGESVGIFANSGSGKSTLIKIILGLIKPNNGTFTLNNNVIKIHNNDSWIYNFACVNQNFNLLDDTIENNITFGTSSKTNKIRLKEVIRMSKLENFIKNLPNGLNTLVGEKGSLISGGEKQRIAIARALYRNPKILVFDEATNSLDENTEKDIINMIYSLKNHFSLIIISHNKINLANCDNIIKL